MYLLDVILRALGLGNGYPAFPFICRSLEFGVERGLPKQQKKSFCASTRLGEARRGVPDIYAYKVYPSSKEKARFNITTRVDGGKLVIQVYPVAYYHNDKLVMLADRKPGVNQAFLPSAVLYEGFNMKRIPQRLRGELTIWALLIQEGVTKYEEKRRELCQLRKLQPI